MYPIALPVARKNPYNSCGFNHKLQLGMERLVYHYLLHGVRDDGVAVKLFSSYKHSVYFS